MLNEKEKKKLKKTKTKETSMMIGLDFLKRLVWSRIKNFLILYINLKNDKIESNKTRQKMY